MGRAKGSNMVHMRTFVRRRGGDELWERVLARLSPEEAVELGGLVTIGWYELGLQHRLLNAVDAELGTADGSLIDEIGRFEAEQDLTIVHRLFLRMANPAFVLEKSGDYWRRFYDTGSWEVERTGKKGARGELQGVDPFVPEFGRYLHAYIVRMWELVGAQRLHTAWEVREGSVLYIEGRWR